MAIVAAFNISDGWRSSIVSSARQDAANQQQRRQQQNDWHELDIAKAEATQPAKIQASKNFYYGLATVGVVAVAILGLTLSGSLSYVTIGYSRAVVKQANARSTQVHLDPKTGQYPLIVFEMAGKPRLYNPNTGQVVHPEQASEPVPQLATGAAYVQAAGVIAAHASKSSDPAGVASVNPPLIIDVKESN